MINKTDKIYQDLLDNILKNGRKKGDRTGTGTISIPHASLVFDMSEGFPLLTTKKMFTKGIIHELLWFLNGDTNIQYLVNNGVNIWTPDAYKNWCKQFEIGLEFDSEEFQKGYGDQIMIESLLENQITPHNIATKSYNRGRINAYLEGKAIKPEFYLTKDEFINKIKTDDEFAKKWGELGPIYGKQWVKWGSFTDKIDYVPNGSMSSPQIIPVKRSWSGINQIQNVIDTLKTNPDSRRMIVSAWNVGELDKMALPPCHWAFELYTEELTLEERTKLYIDEYMGGNGEPSGFLESKLTTRNIPTRRVSLKWHQRSVDTFLGLPFNIASYGLLLHMFAQQTNMSVGTLIADLTNVHIYANHVEQCLTQISREPMPLPKLELEKADDIFSYCYENIKFTNYNSHSPIKGEISV